MLVEERRDKILSLLNKHGKVRVKDLSRLLKTSEVTIRNDLQELHQRGRLRKTHGGAMPLDLLYEGDRGEGLAARKDGEKRIRANFESLLRVGKAADEIEDQPPPVIDGERGARVKPL